MTLYLVTLLMSIVVCFAACRFSFFEFNRWVRGYPVFLICTFQNFLHGTALLPQLVVFRQRGFVARAAARFLVLTGIKLIMEFAEDSAVTFIVWSKGQLQFHEIS